MKSTALKSALAVYASYATRNDSCKPPTCNVPIVHMQYPELFEAFAWDTDCVCKEKCIYKAQQTPSYDKLAYSTYISFLDAQIRTTPLLDAQIRTTEGRMDHTK